MGRLEIADAAMRRCLTAVWKTGDSGLQCRLDDLFAAFRTLAVPPPPAKTSRMLFAAETDAASSRDLVPVPIGGQSVLSCALSDHLVVEDARTHDET